MCKTLPHKGYSDGNQIIVKRPVRVCNAHGSSKPRPAFVGPKGGNSLKYHRGCRDKPGKKPRTALMFLTIKVKHDADNDQCPFSLERFSTSCWGKTRQK